MANVKFSLKYPNNNIKESLVSLVYRFDGKKLVYSTSLKALPKDFNKNSNRFKRTYPDYQLSNEWLDKLEAETKKAHHNFRNENINPTVQDFKDYLNIFTNKVQAPEDETNLLSFIEKIIKERANKKGTNKGTIKTYNNCIRHIRLFSEKKKRQFTFDDIDLIFLDGFESHLYDEDVSTNYAAKMVKILKVFLNEAVERDLTKNLKFRSKKFRIKETSTDGIYLNQNEVDKIFHYDFSDNKRLERVRDLFVIGCCTGLRYSDFSTIRKENLQNIEGVDVIVKINQKTKVKTIIPIHSYVRLILARYEGNTPRAIKQQKLNQYIKEVCQIIGIDDEIIKVTHKGGVEKKEVKKKYEMVATHTARRSFATNAYKAGMPIVSIIKMTGHESTETLLKYIKVSKEENALLMAKHAFFQNKRILKAI